MTEEEIIKDLKNRGYDKVWVYEAEPDEIDEEHTHEFDTKLHILSGEIKIKKIVDGVINDFLLRPGAEIEIPRNEIHYAKVGDKGCKYIVAEKY